jgi:transcriptional regulator with XRE-family HTH domain
MSLNPQELRAIIAANIREMRMKKFPGRGGAKKCALSYGVSPQQWSPWERGTRTPGEAHMHRLSAFFQVDATSFLLPVPSMAVPSFEPVPEESAMPPSLGVAPEAFRSESGQEGLLSLLLGRQIKAIYRVELLVTDLTYEPA